jgi:hypothetical protein
VGGAERNPQLIVHNLALSVAVFRAPVRRTKFLPADKAPVFPGARKTGDDPFQPSQLPDREAVAIAG